MKLYILPFFTHYSNVLMASHSQKLMPSNKNINIKISYTFKLEQFHKTTTILTLHSLHMYGLSFTLYLDWYVTDSHTKMCFGDQFFSVISCLSLLLFCFWYECLVLIKKIWVCEIYRLIRVGYAKHCPCGRSF